MNGRVLRVVKGQSMIKINRFPSGQFLEYMARDIRSRKSEALEPENMLDGKLGYMWLIFGTCLRKRTIDWSSNQFERNKVVIMTLDKARQLRGKLIKGKDIEEQIEFYHNMLDLEAKRRGGVIVDIDAYH